MTFILLAKVPPFIGQGQRLYDNIKNRSVDFEKHKIVRDSFDKLYKRGATARDFIK